MGKKDYTQGLAGLLAPTVTVEKKEEKAVAVKVENEATESLFINPISSALKRRMDVYCAENKIKKHEFISEAIKRYLDMMIL